MFLNGASTLEVAPEHLALAHQRPPRLFPSPAKLSDVALLGDFSWTPSLIHYSCPTRMGMFLASLFFTL